MNTIYKVAKWDAFANRDLRALYTTSEKRAEYFQEIFSVDDDEWENTYVEKVILLDESDTVYLPFTIIFGKEGDVLNILPNLKSITVGSDELIRKMEDCRTHFLSTEITVVATSTEEAVEKAKAKYKTKAKYDEIRKESD